MQNKKTIHPPKKNKKQTNQKKHKQKHTKPKPIRVFPLHMFRNVDLSDFFL